jgi:5-methylthioribose kinase
MQEFNCKLGHWKAQAQVQQIEDDKLMAIISVTDESGAKAVASRHTVVFEHKAGQEPLEEARALVQRLLNARYGS